MNYGLILSLDPSGSYHEGKGTTGWSVYDCSAQKFIHAGSISASCFPSMEAYWDSHLKLISKFHKKFQDRLGLVIEDYLLYATKATEQINSRMETPKLLGVLQHYCWQQNLNYHMQLASEVKTRWTDEILHHKNILIKKGRGYALPDGTQIDRHCKDSIRHGIHYALFKNNRR